MLQLGEIIEGEITEIAFGGEGILRHENFVVFVPFTLQGEKIKCRIVEMHKSFARGVIVAIVLKSPMRIIPQCKYFESCGGCQFQHIVQEKQGSIKHKLLSDALQRIGHFEKINIFPVEEAETNWAYRRHVTLHLYPEDKGYSAGYVSMDAKKLAPIDQCPIFLEKSNSFLQYFTSIVSQFCSENKKEARVTVFKYNQKQFICHFQFDSLPKNFALIVEKALAKDPFFAGIVATTAKKSHYWSHKEFAFTIDELDFLGSSLAFIQNHPEQSAKLYKRICDFCKAINPKKVLDLYCGIGVVSIMLTKLGIKTIGVEYSQEAINMAGVNARKNGFSDITFIQADVQKVLKNLLEKENPDFVILNPPRKGLSSAVIAQLLKRPPKDILYISCMPATLARDLKVFCASTYEIQECQPFDMFPQTTHLETLVHLKRK